jgi:hypothetical protein
MGYGAPCNCCSSKAKSIPPPGPRAVWGGNAGPGASAASAASGSAQAGDRGNDGH